MTILKTLMVLLLALPAVAGACTVAIQGGRSDWWAGLTYQFSGTQLIIDFSGTGLDLSAVYVDDNMSSGNPNVNEGANTITIPSNDGNWLGLRPRSGPYPSLSSFTLPTCTVSGGSPPTTPIPTVPPTKFPTGEPTAPVTLAPVVSPGTVCPSSCPAFNVCDDATQTCCCSFDYRDCNYGWCGESKERCESCSGGVWIDADTATEFPGCFDEYHWESCSCPGCDCCPGLVCKFQHSNYWQCVRP